ncbi:MAG TPA: shikimate dehydrogenase [Bacillota bacterium]|nr:shikimate dehydrogenase [Bacillota bacterium]
MGAITGKTKVVGIFGYPVEHSFSPAMHNGAFQFLGLDYAYLPFPVHPDNLAAGVNAVRALGLAGVNVTIPHKQAVIPFLDEVTPEAELIGAVNTIVNREGWLVGHNTDGQGFVTSLQKEAGVTPEGLEVLILGSGGAARGVAVQLALAGASNLYLVNRSLDKGAELAQVISLHTSASAQGIPWTPQALADLSHRVGTRECLVINTTPLGMYPHQHTVPPHILEVVQPGWLVADLVYNPVETQLLDRAAAKGCRTLSGLGMLLYQGALAFQLWTGHTAPLKTMEEIIHMSIDN